MKNLKELSLVDLIALYNNHVSVQGHNIGAAYYLLSETEFNEVQREIRLRLEDIEFH